MSSVASETDRALAELTSHVRALATRVDALDTHSEQRARALQADLDTALQALALIHDDDPRARRRLRELRAGSDYEAAYTVPDPLVSVIIPTWNRADMLIERSIPSVLDQTHPNIEVIVVGDASPPQVSTAIESLQDRRVRFHNLTVRGPYDDDPFRAWLASGTPGVNAGVALARGLWIAALGDDDAFVPDHIERLLGEARRRRLEFVYGRIRQTLPDGSVSVLGEFPPRVAQVALQSAIYHSGLRFMELELGHALFETPNDWGLIRRMMRTGVRMGMVSEVSVDYWPSLHGHTPTRERLPDLASEKVLELSAHVVEMDAQTTALKTQVVDLQQKLAEEHLRSQHLNNQSAELTQLLNNVRSSLSWRLTAPLRRLLRRSRNLIRSGSGNV
jgi:hypothetical protein